MRAYLAELVGTFALVFIGTGAIIVNDFSGGVVTHLGVSIAFGGIVTAMVYAFGSISGAHINPAVTIAFWLSGRFPGNNVAPYIIAQLIGACGASSVLHMLYPSHPNLGATLPSYHPALIFVIEVLITFFLMYVIIIVVSGSKKLEKFAGLAIGAAVMLAAFMAGPMSGASMNPARSIAPALFAGQLEYIWLYILAPMTGASLAIAGCRILRKRECCSSPYCKPSETHV